MNQNLTISRSITKKSPFKLCFVCLGNICRSPTAEGILRHLVNNEGLHSYFKIDSAGTSAYHIGEPANGKSRQTAKQHGIALHSKARRFELPDLDYFDLILAMDSQNLTNIGKLDSGNRYSNKIALLRDFDIERGNGEVPDPYYGGREGFENVFQIVYRSCESLLDQLKPYIKKG